MHATINGFLASIRRRGLSPATATIYGWALRDLETWLAARGVVDVRELDRELLEGWQDSLQQRLSPKSRAVAATAVRGCLLWAADRDLVDWRLQRSVVTVRTAKGMPRPIPLKNLRRIVAYLAPRRRGATERELRDRALFTLLLTTGARISEVLRLERAAILEDRPVVVQKGGSQKRLLITPTARQQLLDYLARRPDDLPWLFVTTEARRQLGRQQVQRAWKLLAGKVGVPRWTSHQLRHTCATEMRRAGISPLVIAEHLGHSNLATLPNYAAIVDEDEGQKIEALEALLHRGVDRSGPDKAGFQAPVRIVGSRPDNRISRGGARRRGGRR